MKRQNKSPMNESYKIKSRSLLRALISDSLIYLEEKAGMLPKEVFAKLEDSIYDEFTKVIE